MNSHQKPIYMTHELYESMGLKEEVWQVPGVAGMGFVVVDWLLVRAVGLAAAVLLTFFSLEASAAFRIAIAFVFGFPSANVFHFKAVVPLTILLVANKPSELEASPPELEA